jgi:hypothetical protein
LKNVNVIKAVRIVPCYISFNAFKKAGLPLKGTVSKDFSSPVFSSNYSSWSQLTSLTTFRLFALFIKLFNNFGTCISGVIDTGKQFLTGVTDTGK